MSFAVRSLWRRPKGRVLEVKFGYNPNSSSIGADLTPLLIFASALTFIVPAVVIYLKSHTKPGGGEPLPGQAVEAAAGAAAQAGEAA